MILNSSLPARFYLYEAKPCMLTEIGHLSFPSRKVIESWVLGEKLWPIWNEEYLTHGADCSRLDRYRQHWDSIREHGGMNRRSSMRLLRNRNASKVKPLNFGSNTTVTNRIAGSSCSGI